MTSAKKDDAAKARWFTPGKILATTGAIVGLTAAVVGLAFGFDPGLRPCLGNSQASIKSTIVPHVRNRDFLLRHGTSRSDAQNEPNYLGAEVRYTIQADSLRGHDLPIKSSLFYVGKDGTLGAIAANEDRVWRWSSAPRPVQTRAATTSWCRSHSQGATIESLLSCSATSTQQTELT